MSQPHPELLILAIVLIALALAPVASHLVKLIGDQVSSELDSGLTGQALNDRLASNYEGAMRDDEIEQMLEAYAFLRGEEVDLKAEARRIEEEHRPPPHADPELIEEIRQVVIAGNDRLIRAGKPPLDVDAEVVRQLAAVLGSNGHSRS
jgi:hypothetical protein